MTDESLFTAALDVTDPTARSGFLKTACPDDPARRERVAALLAAHAAAGSFLGRPAVDPNATAAPDPAATGTFDPNRPSDDEPLAFLQPSARPDALGRIGHYDVLEVLGRGGFGIVFRAFDDTLQRVVAVKVLAPQLATTSPARKRFLREARSSAAVRHDNVVQVYAVEEQPLPFLVMEFLPGETLQQRIDRTGPLDVPEVLRLGRQIADGLAAAHATGLIHRDVKPANVMIDTGPQPRAKLTDFGLARAADDASISQSGIVAGTPMYMAPEQARGDALDHRADLFSLGSVLYVMATGRPPFRASTTMAVLKRVCDDEPRPIREIIPEAPEWFCRIVAKLHAKNADERFQTAKDVAELLADCEQQVAAHGMLQDYSRIPGGKPTAVRQHWALSALPFGLVVGLALGESLRLWTGRTTWESVFDNAWWLGCLSIVFAVFWAGGRLFGFRDAGVFGITWEYWSRWFFSSGIVLAGTAVGYAFLGPKLLPILVVVLVVVFGLVALANHLLVRRSDLLLAEAHQRNPSRSPRRARPILALAFAILPFLFFAIWNSPFVTRYAKNVGAVEIEPADGLISVAVYPNDRNEAILFTRKTARRLNLPPGSYRLEPTVATGREVDHWEITTIGLRTYSFGMEMRGVPAPLLEIGRGEAVTVRAVLRDAPVPTPQADAARIQGEWVSESAERAGQATRFLIRATFAGNTIRMVESGGPTDAGTFLLNPAATPPQIDVTGQDRKTRFGIYRFDGNRLHICMGEGAERPTTFSSAGGPTRLSVKLRREPSAEAAYFQSLHDLVKAKEQAAQKAATRVAAGLGNPTVKLAAEVELADARVRLADALGDKPAVVGHLTTLVALRQEERRLAGIRAEAGTERASKLSEYDARLADARARLAAAGGSVAVAGFVPLFNGKDLTGWKPHPDQPGNWKVEDQVLVGRGGPSHLFTQRDNYGDFHLRAQVKINVTGDSGIWFRTPFDLSRVSKITGLRYPSGLEAQIYCKPSGDEDGKFTGSLGREAPVLASLHQPDQWFDLEIIARGDLVTTAVNGRPAAELRLPPGSARTGHIALQSGGSGRSTVVQFRKIEIQELPVESLPEPPERLPFPRPGR